MNGAYGFASCRNCGIVNAVVAAAISGSCSTRLRVDSGLYCDIALSL